jgi:hypothetical protein
VKKSKFSTPGIITSPKVPSVVMVPIALATPWLGPGCVFINERLNSYVMLAAFASCIVAKIDKPQDIAISVELMNPEIFIISFYSFTRVFLSKLI